MSDTTAGVLQAGVLVILLAAVHVPLGNYMARMYASKRHLAAERGLYRVMGIDPEADQRWSGYLRSLLAFSFVSVIFLYAFQRLQHHLLLSLGFPGVKPDQAWNTAVSFLTNTNWQSYSGESTMGHLVQMAGLAVQNFVSAAVGIAVAVALIRGFTRSKTDRLGNFWVDLTRGCLRLLLPLSFVFAIVLVLGGVIQNLHGDNTITTLAGGHQTLTGGPVASQEAIKELGTNGGGFYNANSAHPFENPNAWTDLLEIFLLLAIPFSLPRTFGKLVGDKRQGFAILAAMAVIWAGAVFLTTTAEMSHHGTVPTAVGAAMEGKETRFGVPASALFATSTTLDVDGCRQQLPRQLHRTRRWNDDGRHDDRGSRTRRRRLGALRNPRPRNHHRLRRRPHGGPDAGVPGQEDPGPGGEARQPVHPGHACLRAHRCRDGDRLAR